MTPWNSSAKSYLTLDASSWLCVNSVDKTENLLAHFLIPSDIWMLCKTLSWNISLIQKALWCYLQFQYSELLNITSHMFHISFLFALNGKSYDSLQLWKRMRSWRCHVSLNSDKLDKTLKGSLDNNKKSHFYFTIEPSFIYFNTIRF